MADQANKYEEVTKMVEASSGGKKIKGFAKKLTYIIIIVAFLVGVIGSFGLWGFDMDAYVKFLPAVSLFIIPLILSIGANSVVTKIKEKDLEKEKVKVDAIVHANDGAVS